MLPTTYKSLEGCLLRCSFLVLRSPQGISCIGHQHFSTSTSSIACPKAGKTSCYLAHCSRDLLCFAASRGLSGGAIAGIVVGVLAGLLAVAVVVVLSLRRRSLKQVTCASRQGDLLVHLPGMLYPSSSAFSVSEAKHLHPSWTCQDKASSMSNCFVRPCGDLVDPGPD